ncbi:unnamed protein product, partial [Phaeothamnion confervicola]
MPVATLPPQCFSEILSVWSCLQMLGELVKLGPFDLYSLVEALAPGASALGLPPVSLPAGSAKPEAACPAAAAPGAAAASEAVAKSLSDAEEAKPKQSDAQDGSTADAESGDGRPAKSAKTSRGSAPAGAKGKSGRKAAKAAKAGPPRDGDGKPPPLGEPGAPTPTWPGGGGAADPDGLIARLHMRLLDFLAWDALRAGGGMPAAAVAAAATLPEGYPERTERYWKRLLFQPEPPVDPTKLAPPVEAKPGPGRPRNPLKAPLAPAPTAEDEEEEISGPPETTLPGLRGSWGLLRSTPGGWVEMARLLFLTREHVLADPAETAEGQLAVAVKKARAETAAAAAAAAAGAQAAVGAGAGGGGGVVRGGSGLPEDPWALLTLHLDPEGECGRIVRFLVTVAEKEPHRWRAAGHGSGSGGGGAGAAAVTGDAEGSSGGGGAGGGSSSGGLGPSDSVMRNTLTTVLSRLECGWYEGWCDKDTMLAKEAEGAAKTPYGRKPKAAAEPAAAAEEDGEATAAAVATSEEDVMEEVTEEPAVEGAGEAAAEAAAGDGHAMDVVAEGDHAQEGAEDAKTEAAPGKKKEGSGVKAEGAEMEVAEEPSPEVEAAVAAGDDAAEAVDAAAVPASVPVEVPKPVSAMAKPVAEAQPAMDAAEPAAAAAAPVTAAAAVPAVGTKSPAKGAMPSRMVTRPKTRRLTTDEEDKPESSAKKEKSAEQRAAEVAAANAAAAAAVAAAATAAAEAAVAAEEAAAAAAAASAATAAAVAAGRGASFGRGYEGIAMDVALVVDAVRRVHGEASPAAERARGMGEEFQALYRKGVQAPLARAGELAASALATAPAAELALTELDCSDAATVAAVMTTREYADWPATLKVRVLSWLCDEVLSADTTREMMDRAAAARETVARRDREVRTAARAQLRELEEDAAEEAAKVTASRRGGGPCKMHAAAALAVAGSEADVVQRMVDGENADMRLQRKFASLALRAEPLGYDRDWRRYWIFGSGASAAGCDNDDADAPPATAGDDVDAIGAANAAAEAGAGEGAAAAAAAGGGGKGKGPKKGKKAALGDDTALLDAPLTAGCVYVEEERDGAALFRRLTTRHEILSLYAWLDRRGQRERHLKAVLREHLAAVGVSDVRVSAADAEQVALAAKMNAGEETHKVRERERRERDAARAALAAAVLAPGPQREALAASCRDLKVDLAALAGPRALEDGPPYGRGPVLVGRRVRIGPHGLGLSLQPRGGSVCVKDFREQPEGHPNPSQGCGVRRHDFVLAVNRFVADSPTQLAHVLQREGLVAGSGRVIDMRLARGMTLLGPEGGGEAGADGIGGGGDGASSFGFGGDASGGGACSAEAAADASPAALLQGMLLMAESALNHPFCVAPAHRGRVREAWRAAVLDAFPVAGLPPGSSVTGHLPKTVTDGVRTLAERMLELEAALVARGTVLRAGWATAAAGSRMGSGTGAGASGADADATDGFGMGPDGEYELVSPYAAGQRRKWRRYVGQALTVAQLLLAWGALDAAIRWRAVRDISAELDREEFLSLLPSYRCNAIPDVGDVVLYFGEGQRAAAAIERERGAFPLPPPSALAAAFAAEAVKRAGVVNTGAASTGGSSASGGGGSGGDNSDKENEEGGAAPTIRQGYYPDGYTLPPGGGEEDRAVAECRVLAVDYETGGPCVDGRADWRDGREVARRWGDVPTPFARFKLEVLPKGSAGPDGAKTPLAPVGLRPPADPKAKFCRLLRRVVKVCATLPEADPFQSPVDPDDIPDYGRVVAEPMDLQTLAANCADCIYNSVGEFEAHLRLIAINCHRFCEDRYPGLPPLADKVVEVGLSVLHAEPLATQLSEAEKAARQLEEYWQEKMRTAIVSAGAKAGDIANALGIALVPAPGGGGAAGGALGLAPMQIKPKTARIAREVFFDRMLPVVYGTTDGCSAAFGLPEDAADGKKGGDGSKAAAAVEDGKKAVAGDGGKPDAAGDEGGKTAAGKGKKAAAGNGGGGGEAAGATASEGGATDAGDAGVGKTTSKMTGKAIGGASSFGSSVEQNGAGGEGGGGGGGDAEVEGGSGIGLPLAKEGVAPGTTFYVCQRLSNDLPEFCVPQQKYAAAVNRTWRMEQQIQGPFVESDSHEPVLYIGTVVGIRSQLPSGYMPWDS